MCRRNGFFLASLLAVLLLGPAAAEANTVMVRASDVQLTRSGDVVTVTGHVAIRNIGSSSLTGVAVVGPEDGPLKGQVMYIGVVPPDSEVVSDGVYTFEVDTTKTSLINIMVPVTVQFSLDGNPQEISGGLSQTIPR
jgi:hypothetical protein